MNRKDLTKRIEEVVDTIMEDVCQGAEARIDIYGSLIMKEVDAYVDTVCGRKERDAVEVKKST